MVKKKFTAFAAIVAAGALVLASCGSSSDGSETSSGTSGSSSSDTSSGDDGDAVGSDEDVTISYWQYTYPTKVDKIKELVERFEDENPGIHVDAEDYPYDQFQNKVMTAHKAGNGPDIVNIYNGWVPQFAKQGIIQQIPEDYMSSDDIQDFYVDTVGPQGSDGEYYALPIAVRSLALFWNKDLFEEAGLDPEDPPATWDELIDDAKKMTKFTDDGRYEQEGFGWNADGQGYHTFEEVLLRQWGGVPFSDDGKTVLFDDTPGGLEAFKYWVDMTKEHKIGAQDFNTDYSTAFVAGKAGMIIDGSFRLGDLKDVDFDWGVTELPVREEGGVQSNFASYWANALTSDLSGKKLEAAEKFMDFLISPDVEKEWLDAIGELPAAASLADDPDILGNETYAPFVKALAYGHTTQFVNEEAERDAFLNVIDQILLNDVDYETAFNDLVDQEQQVRDEFYAD